MNGHLKMGTMDEKGNVNMLTESPADAVTILYDNGAFFLVVTPKGSNPMDSKRIVCQDLSTLEMFLRGFFKESTETHTQKMAPESLGAEPKSAIGFTSGLANAA